MKIPRVVVVGGGFAGLNAVQALRRANVEILLIDRTNHHLFQPLLYQVSAAVLSPANIASPLRGILASQKNASVLMADITAINKEKDQVVAANGETYGYDYLVLAPGARHSYFGHPEWEEFAPGLKTLNDALRIRERILLSYERAERCKNFALVQRFMTFVVIGGGPTGVELAGAIAEIARKSLVHNFRHIAPEHTKVYLIEGESRVLPGFPPELSKKAKQDLESLGVQVMLDTYVTNVTADGVWCGEQFIESPNVFWAAGNAASPLLKTLNVPLDRAGRVPVNADLSIPGYPYIFVIGDAAACQGKDDLLPGIAPVAMQQGTYVGKLIKNETPPQERKPFKYTDRGMMATIGKTHAVAVVGKKQLSGFLAWLAWGFIHVAYLITFQNRLTVMLNWIYLYLRNKRGTRLITRPITDSEDPIP